MMAGDAPQSLAGGILAHLTHRHPSATGLGPTRHSSAGMAGSNDVGNSYPETHWNGNICAVISGIKTITLDRSHYGY